MLESTGGAYTQVGSDLPTSATSLPITGLANATAYTFEILALNASGASVASTTAVLTTTPATPTNFSVQGVSGTEIDLAWTDSTGAAHYQIERSLDGLHNWTTLSGTVAPGTQSYHDTGLNPGTSYSYRIEALDAGGASIATAVAAGLTSPDAPTNLTATPISAGEIDLAWDAMSNADHYIVSVTTGGVTTVLNNHVGTTTYHDLTTTGGTGYTYHVVAVNATGNSSASDTSTVTTVPATPAGFTSTGVSSGEIDLAWTDVAGATDYQVERSPDGVNNWTTLSSTVAPGTQSYHDTGLAAGTSYTYRIEALDATGASLATATHAGLTAPAAPTNLTATPINAGEVDLAWDAMTGADHYIVSVTTGGVTTVLNSNVATNSYHDLTTTGGTGYTYHVVAINATGNSLTSDTATVTTVPAAQADLAAVPHSATEVDLSWSDVTGATSYTLSRSTGGGSFTALNDPALAGNVASFNDTTAVPGTTYTYQIVGADATGNSAATTVTALTVPAAVTNPTGAVISSGEIDLTWTADSGTVSGYRVLQSTGGAFSQVGLDLASDATGLNVTGLTDATAYTFRVLALNATGASGNSDTATYTTLPTTPTAFTATGVSSGEIDLAWTDVTGATDYQVERSPDGVNNWTTLSSTVAPGTQAYHDTGLAAGTSYSYRVEALDAGGASVATAIQAGLTAPAAPTNLTPTPISAGEVDLAWDAMTGANHYVVSATTGGVTTVLNGNVTTNSYHDLTTTGGTDYTYHVVAVNATGSSAAADSATVTTVPSTPGGFSAAGASNSAVNLTWSDVPGATAYQVERSPDGVNNWTTVSSAVAPGTISYQNTQFVVSGSGADIWGSNDQFRYVSRSAQGDGQIVAAVSNQSATDQWAKAGLMYRASTDSASYFVDLLQTPRHGTQLQWRDGGGVHRANGPSIGGTAWLELVRSGNTFSGYTSSDGVNYSLLSSVSVSMPSGILQGLAVTSHNTSAISNVTFSGVSPTFTSVNDTAPWTAQDIGSPAISGGPFVNVYTDTGLSAGTSYSYRVEALDATGASAATSVLAGLTTPAAPTNLTPTPISAGEVDLAWDAMTGADHYIVSATTGGVTTVLNGNVTTNSYHDLTTTGGTDYTYHVVAVNATGNSASSDTSTVTTVPAAQSNLAAVPHSATEVDLSWSDVTGATSYTLSRSTGGGSFTALNDPALAGNVASFNDTTAVPGTTYTYQIVGADATGNSAATTVTALTVPAAVTNPTGAVISSGEIDLTWTADSGTVSGYRVLQSTGGAFSQVGLDLASDATGLNVTGLTDATAYTFRVLALNATGASGNSDTSIYTTLPTAPTAFTATGVSSGEIDLAWTDVTGATDYQVERSPDGVNNWTTLSSTVAPGTQSYHDTGLSAGTSYSYRVEALDAGGASIATAIQTVSTRPDVVTGLTPATVSSGEIDLTWAAATGATGYHVLRSTDGVNFSPIHDVSAASYNNTGIAEGTAYSYEIVPFNASGDGVADSGQSATTLLNTPDVAASSIATTGFTLTWTNHSTLDTAYEVDQQIAGSWTDIHDDSAIVVNGNTGSFNVSGLTEATTYAFRVIAVGTSVNSAAAPITVNTAPTDPTSLVATSNSVASVTLNWANSSAGADGYRIQRLQHRRSAVDHAHHRRRQRQHLHRFNRQRSNGLCLSSRRLQRHDLQRVGDIQFRDNPAPGADGPFGNDRCPDRDRPGLDRQLRRRDGLSRLSFDEQHQLFATRLGPGGQRHELSRHHRRRKRHDVLRGCRGGRRRPIGGFGHRHRQRHHAAGRPQRRRGRHHQRYLRRRQNHRHHLDQRLDRRHPRRHRTGRRRGLDDSLDQPGRQCHHLQRHHGR